MINRYVFPLMESRLWTGKTLLLLGPRRVGKTFLSKLLVEKHGGIYYNCDLQEVRELLDTESKVALSQFVDRYKLVIFDEAQVIPGIGKKLKILHDSFPDVQFIATGSSSFDLVNQTAEPLTGRSRVFYLYSLSYSEIGQYLGKVEAHGRLQQLLIYGSYPEVFLSQGTEKREELMQIADNYLYKDILQLATLRRTDLLNGILKLLAYQVGSEVSLNKIANQTNASIHTVSNYLELLEKSFVIFSLSAFSRNLAKEIGKSKKYYFYDLGIRNAIIRNFSPLNARNDVGALWENFCLIERIKRNAKHRLFTNQYFWRTYDQQEIDYLEEYDGKLRGYEFKYSKTSFRKPAIFLKTYKNSDVTLINNKTFFEFLE